MSELRDKCIHGIPLVHQRHCELCFIQDKIEKLQKALEKAIECIEEYADLNDDIIQYDSRGVTYARQTLKQLKESDE